MKPIRRKQANNDFGPDASMSLPQAAHLKVKSYKLFEPKFHEETGALWTPTLSLIQEVIDDYDEGDYDGETFSDRFELKIDDDLYEALGIEDDKPLRNSTSKDWNKEQRELLTDM